MKRLAASFALLLPLAALVLPTTEAGAAGAGTGVPVGQSSGVSLLLLRQTPWNSPQEPLLHIAVLAVNHGTKPIAKLSFEVTIYTPVRSRSEYQIALTGEPINPSVQFAQRPQLLPKLDPGQARTITSTIDLTSAGLSARGENAVYPTKIELRSNDVPVDVIRSPVIFVDFPAGQKRAKFPLRVSWLFVLDAPVLFEADGAFDERRVANFLAPGARLRQELGALSNLLSGHTAQPFDLVISPTLISELGRLRDGYRAHWNGSIHRFAAGKGLAADADAALKAIRGFLRSPLVEVSAMPLSTPNLPALLDSPLAGDLTKLVGRGRTIVAGLGGARPSRQLFRPPRSYLDQQSIYTLSRLHLDLLLVDPTLVARPPAEQEFLLPPTASLQTSPSSSITALVPDAGIDQLLAPSSAAKDPHLLAQSVLGELAQVWLEHPGNKRGLVLSLPEDETLPGGLFGPLVRGISSAPWMQELTATELAREFPPPPDPAQLVPKVGPAYPDGYVNKLLLARRDVAVYRSILVRPSTTPTHLDDLLLVAENGAFASSTDAGAAFLDAVMARVRGEFAKIVPDTGTLVTLASRNGVIPLSLVNRTGHPVRVAVQLLSNRLEPVPPQVVTLRQPQTTVLFHVRARTTGRFPVEVQLLTPGPGRIPLHPAYELVIRSTAYNVVALVITIGAAVFLLLWWSRRFLPRYRARTT